MRLVNILLATMFLLTLPACILSSSDRDASNTSKTIKIVSSLPRHGNIKPAIDTFINGFEMALTEANYKAGDYTIVYEDWNNADQEGHWQVDLETENAEKAVLDPD